MPWLAVGGQAAVAAFYVGWAIGHRPLDPVVVPPLLLTCAIFAGSAVAGALLLVVKRKRMTCLVTIEDAGVRLLDGRGQEALIRWDHISEVRVRRILSLARIPAAVLTVVTEPEGARAVLPPLERDWDELLAQLAGRAGLSVDASGRCYRKPASPD